MTYRQSAHCTHTCLPKQHARIKKKKQAEDHNTNQLISPLSPLDDAWAEKGMYQDRHDAVTKAQQVCVFLIIAVTSVRAERERIGFVGWHARTMYVCVIPVTGRHAPQNNSQVAKAGLLIEVQSMEPLFDQPSQRVVAGQTNLTLLVPESMCTWE